MPYVTAARAAEALAPLARRGESKFLRALAARQSLLPRYRAWGDEHRRADVPLVWVHAPSVGEGLQALPVIRRLRQAHPSVQVAYTFYSPSAERFAGSLDSDFADYLPLDSPESADAVIRALRPNALVFSKLDVWPILVERARSAGVRIGLISGTVPAGSARRLRFARAILRDAYSAIELAGAISEADAERLVELGVHRDRVSVTGDTRYDQVWERANAPPASNNELRSTERVTLVAGSTWPSDERVLLPAFLAFRQHVTDARLIIAPHEVEPARLESIETWARGAGLSVTRLGSETATDADVVLIDRFGVLGDVYSAGDFAYVGGGFHRAGLHSLLEPAAFGKPVLIGPLHRDNRDAALLVSSGAAVRCNDHSELAAVMRRWHVQREALGAASFAAIGTVRANLGASDKSVRLIERLLGNDSGSRRASM